MLGKILELTRISV